MLLPAPLRAASAALTFLTIIPLGRRVALDGADVARGSVLFPLVGAGIGSSVGAVAWLLGRSTPPMLAAAVAVALGALITGALHLDGLADCADGYGGRTVDDRLRIMRDHTIGTYGAAALLLDLLIKTSALAAVAGTSHALTFAIAAGAMSRIVGPMIAVAMPYAQRRAGAGAALSATASPARATATLLVGAVLAVAAVGYDAWAAILVALLVVAVVRRSCRRRLGGVTGDVMGAAVELVEAAALVALVALQ